VPCKALARYTFHHSSENKGCTHNREPSPARGSTPCEASPVPSCASAPAPKGSRLNTNALHAFLELSESPFTPTITRATSPPHFERTRRAEGFSREFHFSAMEHVGQPIPKDSSTPGFRTRCAPYLSCDVEILFQTGSVSGVLPESPLAPVDDRSHLKDKVLVSLSASQRFDPGFLNLKKSRLSLLKER